MPEDIIKELASRLSSTGILVAADINQENLKLIDTELLVSKIISRRSGASGLSIVNNDEILNIIREMELEKTPMPVEVMHRSGFKPLAAEIDANYGIKYREVERAEGTVDDFVSYFRGRLEELRKIIESHRGNISGLVSSLASVKSYADGREVTIIGIITRRTLTKNGNMMAIVEDETAEAKVIFMNGSSQQTRTLFEQANSLINDEIVAVKGKISGPFIIANDVIWPDVPVKIKKPSEDDVAIAFISDMHIGSKLFMDKNFSLFINWLNGSVDTRSDLAGKIKYIVVGGDVVDGIGVYPNQDKDLAVLDVYTQYSIFFNLIKAVPEYIHVFIIPGNHDAVQRAEPQPQLGSDMIGDFKAENVHILPNPSFLTLHGIDVLTYHGTSLDSIISAIPNTSYAYPERAMAEILKRRHLSPIYGGNIIVPSKHDSMVIDRVPDILHMGHVHKNGIANYHGVDIVNSGTWQARTDYQVLQGHIPTPCILPVFDAKRNEFISIDFNRGV